MRIIVIGGVPRSLVNFRGSLLKAMRERGNEVIACAPSADKVIQGQLMEWGVQYRDITIHRAGMNPLRDMQTLRSLILLFREVRPDVVLAYTVKPVIWGGLAARHVGVPRFFAMITGLGYAFLEGGLRQQAVQRVVSGLYRAALRDSEAVFFQNPDDEAEFRQRTLLDPETPSIRINGSGVELEQFPPQPLPASVVFLLMARLISDKGIREYREAARGLRQRYPEARFLLAGGKDCNPSAIDGEELAQWQREGDIEYLGNLDDVRPALRACSVYVLPSYREGTPRTVLEAMATGRPIVTTDAPGCRETVEEGINGYLVPLRDSQALADAMERFIVEPDLAQRLGEQSLRIVRERYDVHRVNERILTAMGL